MRPLARLIGARIRRIDMPHEELLSLVFAASEERGVLLFCWAAGAIGTGIVPERPHGLAASSFVQKLRKELEGGRIAEFAQPDEATLELLVERSAGRRRLLCHFAEPQIAVFDHAASLLASQTLSGARGGRSVKVAWPESLELLEARGPQLLADRATSAIDQRRALLDKLLRNGVKRLERRLLALAEDAARADRAEPLRARASLLVANLRSVQRGASSVQLMDYTLDPPAPIAIELDPALGAQAQAEGWFKQARRFERGAELALQRRAATEQELARLAELRAQLSAADEAGLERIGQAAREQGVRGLAAGAATRKDVPRSRHKPYRELRGHGQRAILVGKGAEDNDALTREHARPQDLWLHARDVAGAHVVVPLERNETCPEELLLDAAHLAAHFSDARGETNVDVSYTAKRHVHKPRKAPKGMVQLTQHKVLRLQLDRTRLQQLLATELRD
jgi:predicted ribosome quality control (RQC) complex YloA/Tae2 family protein